MPPRNAKNAKEGRMVRGHDNNPLVWFGACIAAVAVIFAGLGIELFRPSSSKRTVKQSKDEVKTPENKKD